MGGAPLSYRIVIRYNRSHFLPESYLAVGWEGSPEQLVQTASKLLFHGEEDIEWSEWDLEIQSEHSETINFDCDTVKDLFHKYLEDGYGVPIKALRDVLREIRNDVVSFLKNKKNLEELIYSEIHELGYHLSFDRRSRSIVINPQSSNFDFESLRTQVFLSLRKKQPDKQISMPMFLDAWVNLCDQLERGKENGCFHCEREVECDLEDYPLFLRR